MAARQGLRKRRLEDKLGLNKPEVIKSAFAQETKDIVWDLITKKYSGVYDHPMIMSQPEETWPNWVFFLLVHNVHASIWAVEEKYLKTVDVVSQDYLTPYDIGECLTDDAVIQRYHVVLGSDDRYYIQPDQVILRAGKEPDFDFCLYVGTLTLSLKALNVIMAMITEDNYLLLQSDCLEYCKSFVFMYFELIEEELSSDQLAVLEKLTVTTNALSQVSERSGRRHHSSGFSLRSLLTGTFMQAYLATVLGGVSVLALYKLYQHLYP